MTTSPQTPFLSNIASQGEISQHHLAYLSERVRNHYYDYVIRKFLEAEKNGLTKADLARRIGKGPDRITKLLCAPGNWTLDTVTELLVGICAEELVPHSVALLDRNVRNHTQVDHFSNKVVEADQTGTSSAPHPPLDPQGVT